MKHLAIRKHEGHQNALLTECGQTIFLDCRTEEFTSNDLFCTCVPCLARVPQDRLDPEWHGQETIDAVAAWKADEEKTFAEILEWASILEFEEEWEDQIDRALWLDQFQG